MTKPVPDVFQSAVVSFEEMKPSEVYTATGLSPDVQRLWRSRGILEKKAGSRASYKSIDVAAIMLAVALAKHGCSPMEAMSFGRKYQHRVLQFAIFNADGVVELVGDRKTVNEFAEMMSNRSEELAAYLAGNQDGEDARLLMSIDGSTFQGVIEAPESDDYTEDLSIVTINLLAAGFRLANRIGRPLVTVEFQPESGSKPPRVRKVLEAKGSFQAKGRGEVESLTFNKSNRYVGEG